MAEFIFRRSFPWIQTAFEPVTFGSPDAVAGTLFPVVEIFGTQRLADVQFQSVAGVLGALEVTHDPVPPERARFYYSMTYFHDDATDRFLRPIIVPHVEGTPPFPQVALRDSISIPNVASGGRTLNINGVWVPPRGRIGAIAGNIAVGSRVSINLVWIELPIGETLGFRVPH